MSTDARPIGREKTAMPWQQQSRQQRWLSNSFHSSHTSAHIRHAVKVAKSGVTTVCLYRGSKGGVIKIIVLK